MKNSHYTHIADLFDFPDAFFVVRARNVEGVLHDEYPTAAAAVQVFIEGIEDQRIEDLQELYTRTFDVQSITTLDVGYVLFGDDYKRAELLANLSREHREVGNDCRGELADHLPNMLRLMTLIGASDIIQELVEGIVVPALLLMIREFDPARISKKNAHYTKHFKTLIDVAPGDSRTIYCRALEALLAVLKQDFGVTDLVSQLTDWASRPQSADFLGRIAREIEIENNANPVNSGQDA